MAEKSRRSYHADMLSLNYKVPRLSVAQDRSISWVVPLCACPVFVLFPGYLALVTAKSPTEILNLAFLLLKWSLFILIIYQPNRLSGRHPACGVWKKKNFNSSFYTSVSYFSNFFFLNSIFLFTFSLPELVLLSGFLVWTPSCVFKECLSYCKLFFNHAGFPSCCLRFFYD